LNPAAPAPAPAATPELQAQYFDGLQAQAHPVRLRLHGGQLHIVGDGLHRSVPAGQVRWPERQRHGVRQAYLPGHGLISCDDSAAWDAWAAASGLRPHRLQPWLQSWRGALLATAALVSLLLAVWHWGLPLAAQGVAAVLPPAVEAQLGEAAFQQIEQRFLQPSALPPERQAALRQRLDHALTRWPGGTAPAHTLHFRASKPRGGLGPNALALPGGTVVVTDELVTLLEGHDAVLVGVLGHELGHLQHRHGVRALVQAGLLAGLSSVLLGDVSQVLAAVPVLLGQAAYSRQAEVEADACAARLLRANGTDPQVMALLFQRLRSPRPGANDAHSDLPIGLASHPPDDERIRRMVATP